jgi:hypothetical protein
MVELLWELRAYYAIMNHALAGVMGVMKERINKSIDNQSVSRSVSKASIVPVIITTGVYHGLHKWYRSLMIYIKQH